MRRLNIALALFLVPAALPAATPDGAEIYKTRCATCHDAGIPRIPTREALKAFSAQAVNKALITGPMRFQGSEISLAERHAVVEFVTEKKLEETVARKGMCAASYEAKPMSGEWNGWSTDLDNSRYQGTEGAGIAAEQVAKLKLKWAFGFPGDFVAFAQPSVIGGKVYVGSAGGTVYSLDAVTGCT
jgi:polyvinyl alcohol dehydrogenase (cytochrome)